MTWEPKNKLDDEDVDVSDDDDKDDDKGNIIHVHMCWEKRKTLKN